MDFNIPSHISPATILKAARFVKNAQSMSLSVGNVYWGDKEDTVYFMLINKEGTLMLVHCCPLLYFIEFCSSDNDTNYSLVTNIRHLTSWIKKNGFIHDFEHLRGKDNGNT